MLNSFLRLGSYSKGITVWTLTTVSSASAHTFHSQLLRILVAKDSRQRLKSDGTRAETRFGRSPKRTSRFKSAGASVQSTTGSRGVRISVSNAGYITFRGSVKSSGHPLHSPVSPSPPLPCITVCHQVSKAVWIYVGLRWRCLSFVSDINHIRRVSTHFGTKFRILTFTNTRAVGGALILADWQHILVCRKH